MNEDHIFRPSRRLGLAVHVTAILLLGSLGLYGLHRASQAELRPAFFLDLLPASLSLFLIPILVYRANALLGATYTVEREGIRLRWGLRAVDIPMDRVQGIYPAHEINYKVPLPVFRFPGSLLGTRQVESERPVEFLASGSSDLILISTPERIYAISPTEPKAFMRAFRQFTELGSLAPLPARSIYPTLILSRFWNDRAARLLLLCGSLASLGLLAWVGLIIPGHAHLSIRFGPDGSPLDPVPGVRLMLLPVLNLVFFTTDVVLGIFLYRRTEGQPLAYLMWSSGLITTLLFAGAVLFILTVG